MTKRRERTARPQVEGLERKEMMSGLAATIAVGKAAQPAVVARTPSIPIPPPRR